jgi:hypothetical protein
VPRIASQGRYVPVPELLTPAVGFIEKRLITPLIPFVWPEAD